MNKTDERRLSMSIIKRNKRRPQSTICLDELRDNIPFDEEIHRVVPAVAFIRNPWRKPKESFMMYRKAMRNMAIATKRIVRSGSYAYLIINKRTLEVETNVEISS